MTGDTIGTRQDSIEVVKGVLKRVVGYHADRRRLLDPVRPDLADLHARVEKVREMGPEFANVELSPYVTQMVRMVGRVNLVEECTL